MCHNIIFFLLGPFTIPVLSIITLTSFTDKKILFKLKTTAPKKYCVRPNSGILYPKSRQEIHGNFSLTIFHRFYVYFCCFSLLIILLLSSLSTTIHLQCKRKTQT